MPPKTPNRAQQTLGKRKMNSNGTPSDPKRRKFDEARAVSSQTVEQAFMDGQVDVNRFVKAREYEIKALEDGLMAMKKVSSTRVFQHVPRSMRRRTASHNVSRVPKRLRAKARVHVSLHEMSQRGVNLMSRRLLKTKPL
jgi:ribonuclease P/MRP protein subunit POP1